MESVCYGTILENTGGRKTNIIGAFLETGKQTIGRVSSFFRGRTSAILEGNPSVSSPTSVANMPESAFVVSAVQTLPTVVTRRESTLSRVEKLNGGLSFEQKVLYRKYRDGLVQNRTRFDIVEIAGKESFIFDVLTRVMRRFVHDGDQEFLTKFIPLREPFFEYITHVIFVLRQAIIGSVVPTNIEMNCIRAILSDERVKKYMVEALNEDDSHSRIQALRAPKLLTRQHPIIQQLIGKDSVLSDGALTSLFDSFSQYFPTNLEKQPEMEVFEEERVANKVIPFIPAPRTTLAPASVPQNTNISVASFKNATVAARAKQNLRMWNELPIRGVGRQFFLTNARDFHSILPENETFPHLIKKNGPCTYSVEKLPISDYMAGLAGKKSFEQMLRKIFKASDLKKFNTRPDLRIPAAILLDIMDNTPITSGEMEFASEVLTDTLFVQTFVEAFGKLQSDSRIGEFNMVKYPHANADTILGFFQKKLR